MSDIEKSVVTATFTIFGGIFVYVVSQFLSKLSIDPLQNLRKAIGETRFNLAYYAAEIHTPINRTQERSEIAREALMKNSCDLLVYLETISFYFVASMLRVVPPRASVEDAAMQLRGLTTYLHETGSRANDDLEIVAKRVSRIEKLLGLKPLK